MNLPQKIVFDHGGEINYLYDAAGIKLKKTVLDGGNATTTDYIGDIVYENNILQFIHTEEGRALTSQALNPAATDKSFVYEYHYKDHLGNLRLSIREGTDQIWEATMETDN